MISRPARWYTPRASSLHCLNKPESQIVDQRGIPQLIIDNANRLFVSQGLDQPRVRNSLSRPGAYPYSTIVRAMK